MQPVQTNLISLGELARYFTRLGATAFGGPAAHIALMERELVEERGWISRTTFLDLLAAANLLPGPTSTELAIHIGFQHRGVRGAIVAGSCFIAPAFVMVLGLAMLYVGFGSLPALHALLYGIAPIVVALVAQASFALARQAWQRTSMLLLGIAGFLLSMLGRIDPVIILLGSGLISLVVWWIQHGQWRKQQLSVLPLALLPQLVGSSSVGAGSLLNLVGLFLKVGLSALGSGYVLFNYLEIDLVHRYGWLSPQQLIDAIAVGQVTPGPLFTSAAFIGYLITFEQSGQVWYAMLSALLCTIAIFSPAFVFVCLFSPLFQRLRRAPATASFMDGVNAAVVGTIIATACSLLYAALCTPSIASAFGLPFLEWRIDLPALLLFLGALGLLLRHPKINALYLIGAGALSGLLVLLVS
jgi:chromate transporter